MKKIVLALSFIFGLSSMADVKMGTIFETKDTWTTSSGEAIKLSRWQGKNLVISLFYSSCRAICPMTVAKIKKIEETLKQKDPDAQYILFTIDPTRDQIKEMAEYKKKHGIDRANWHLISGSENATKKLAAVLGMGFSEPQANRDLHQMHTRKIVLVPADASKAGKPVEITDSNLNEILGKL